MPTVMPPHNTIYIPLPQNGSYPPDYIHPPWTQEGAIERERAYTHDNRSVSAEICHQRISHAYLVRERLGSEEDLIQGSCLTPLSPEEILEIADIATNTWDIIYLTSIKIREKT